MNATITFIHRTHNHNEYLYKRAEQLAGMQIFRLCYILVAIHLCIALIRPHSPEVYALGLNCEYISGDALVLVLQPLATRVSFNSERNFTKLSHSLNKLMSCYNTASDI